MHCGDAHRHRGFGDQRGVARSHRFAVRVLGTHAAQKALAALRADVRRREESLAARVRRAPAANPDADNGRIALLRTTSDGVGGVDLLTARNGEVEPIRSLTRTRAFRY